MAILVILSFAIWVSTILLHFALISSNLSFLLWREFRNCIHSGVIHPSKDHLLFYFVYSGVTRPICAKITSRGSEFYWWVHFTLIFVSFSKKKKRKKEKKHLTVKCITSVTCSDKLSLLCFCFRVWLFLCLF